MVVELLIVFQGFARRVGVLWSPWATCGCAPAVHTVTSGLCQALLLIPFTANNIKAAVETVIPLMISISRRPSARFTAAEAA